MPREGYKFPTIFPLKLGENIESIQFVEMKERRFMIVCSLVHTSDGIRSGVGIGSARSATISVNQKEESEA